MVVSVTTTKYIIIFIKEGFMKRRMKKLAALLLSAVMAMGVLSGCGSSGSGGTTESAAGTEAASAAEGASQEAGKWTAAENRLRR